MISIRYFKKYRKNPTPNLMIRTSKKCRGAHGASHTNLLRPKADISMPQNAISKTTVTQPDDQGTPKKWPGDPLGISDKPVSTKNRNFHAQKRDFKNYRNPT